MAPSLRKIGEKREERRIEEEKEKEWVEGRDTCTMAPSHWKIGEKREERRREGAGVGRREGCPAGTKHGALTLEDRREERRERREGERRRRSG